MEKEVEMRLMIKFVVIQPFLFSLTVVFVVFLNLDRH